MDNVPASCYETNANVEIWAGVECTVNRVREQYYSQLKWNGHADRIRDLDLFAELGVKVIRYPLLWELTAPSGLAAADWSWADVRLKKLRSLDISPIVGLVHHGSGPQHTSLIDDNFVTGLTEFAQAVAQRYPWLHLFNPINEPLTTARFSGLYGHWYPHGKDSSTFIKALLSECRAIVMSMAVIRQINPHAQLIQTEDLGKIFSTPLLAYQAELENERRWLSFDLLNGLIDKHHPLWNHLLSNGASEADLIWFQENPCPPDVYGINHYLTSDRFLDENLDNYPTCYHGGNGQHRYADIEAIRVCIGYAGGIGARIQEVWERYHKPIAVTEVHLGCTREEQLRWLYEAWQEACYLQNQGVDIRAITAWSLLGAYDWNSLLTRADGHYESGVFDVRSSEPRPTALAKMLQHLAKNQNFDHPVLDSPGWWQRKQRLLYPAIDLSGQAQPIPNSAISSVRTNQTFPHPRQLCIIGATGTLGRAFARLCEIRGLSYCLLSRQDIDITDPSSVSKVLAELKPWAVINAAGYVRVDDAELDPHACLRANTDGAANLAAVCAQAQIKFLTFSSDLVFDGATNRPYIESDPVAPLNVYGQSKAKAEFQVLAAHPNALMIRTSAFFGPWDEYNFVILALRSLASGNPFIAANDTIISPTYVPDLVNASLDLLVDGESGLWHLANPEALSWAELAQFAANKAGLSAHHIEARPSHTLGFTAIRPNYSALSSERGILLPSLDQAFSEYFKELIFSFA